MKIQNLEVKNIRGIKYIKINPEGMNLVVFGPNGTGKSAIVDAIDFLLTGEISRLTGEGTKLLSLKEHGCHIDSRVDLKNTIVVAKVKIDDKEIVIERSINRPSFLKVEPKEHKALVESCLDAAGLGLHILSRRDILNYINAEAGKRAKEIMNLMNLSDIENLRSTLVTVRNEAESEFKQAESNLNISTRDTYNLLSLSNFSEEAVLDKVNELRKTLKGSKISELSLEKIRGGIVPYPFEAIKDILTKEQLMNTLGEARSLIVDAKEIMKQESELRNLLEEVRKNTKLRQYSLYKKLLEAGLSLVDESNVCPLCGKKWEEGDLRFYLEKIKKKNDIDKGKQERIDSTSSFIKNRVDLLKNDMTIIVKGHKQFGLKSLDYNELNSCLSLLESWSDVMLDPLDSLESGKWPASNLKDILGASFLEVKMLVPLENTLKTEGDKLSDQQIAWDTLTKMEDHWKRYKEALDNKEIGETSKNRANILLENFETCRDSVLESIYDEVKNDFVKYYKKIHSDDENKFASKITHVAAELIFEVNFYERGMFPPQALHSEGHQDSMGLCLFFALHRYLIGDLMKIIVLDDVVMSIDRDHRRGVCQLMKEYFSDKQFIITTHDTSWAKQLKTEGIIQQKNMIHFINWNIDTGPIFEQDKDLWDKIKEDLEKDDVPSAAHKLRRNAECFFENICDFLSAKIDYKGSHQWELGDYAFAAISAYKQYLKKTISQMKKTLEQEKQKESTELEAKLKDLIELDGKSDKIIAKSQVEQWIINRNVHYNKWDEFSKPDFRPVVQAFKDLFGLFTCSSCGSIISISESKGEMPKALVSCNCGKIFWNIQ